MRENQKRILFLCSYRSVRAQMAASLLSARVRRPWDIWSTEVEAPPQELDLARRVLDELGMALLSRPQTSEPSFGLTWNEGVILCSAAADT